MLDILSIQKRVRHMNLINACWVVRNHSPCFPSIQYVIVRELSWLFFPRSNYKESGLKPKSKVTEGGQEMAFSLLTLKGREKGREGRREGVRENPRKEGREDQRNGRREDG
jgi:hypothetical protein